MGCMGQMIGGVLLMAGTAWAGPRMEVAGAGYDFGEVGRIEKVVYVMSNDPVVPVLRLTLAATVGGRREK